MSRATEKVGRGREREQVRRSTVMVMEKAECAVDQEARDTAQSALSASKAHEELCSERWRTQGEAMARIEKTMGTVNDALNEKIGKLPAGLIAGLTGMVGWLAARAFPLH